MGFVGPEKRHLSHPGTFAIPGHIRRTRTALWQPERRIEFPSLAVPPCPIGRQAETFASDTTPASHDPAQSGSFARTPRSVLGAGSGKVARWAGKRSIWAPLSFPQCHLHGADGRRWRRHGGHRRTGACLEPARGALRRNRRADRTRVPAMADGGVGDTVAGDLVHHLVGLGHPRDHHDAVHRQRQPAAAFPDRLGLGEAFVAGVLLLAGGLTALQTASIAAALPISVIMLFMTYGLLKSLSEDNACVPAKAAA